SKKFMIANRKHILMRGYLISVFLLLIAVGIVYSMIQIRVSEGQELEEFAQQSFRLATEQAERGNLYASGGDLLATTVTIHNIYVDLTVIEDDLFSSEIGILADSLARMFPKPASYFEEKFRKERKKGNRYMTLIKGLDY